MKGERQPSICERYRNLRLFLQPQTAIIKITLVRYPRKDMENSGGYHSKVVLTPERKAKAIYEITEEWLIQNKSNNVMQTDARTSRR
jgi:hypothetical protein